MAEEIQNLDLLICLRLLFFMFVFITKARGDWLPRVFKTDEDDGNVAIFMP